MHRFGFMTTICYCRLQTMFDDAAAALEPFVPHAVTANSVTIANACMRLAALFAAVICDDGELLRLGIALCVLFSLVLDSLDGTLARARGQTSAVGELLDHAMDGVGVPHLALAFVAAIGVEPSQTSAVLVCVSSTALSVVQCVANAIESDRHRDPPMDGALAGVSAAVALCAACVFELHGPFVATVLAIALLINSLGMLALSATPVRAAALTALHIAPFAAMVASCWSEEGHDGRAAALVAVALAPFECMRVAAVYYAGSITARADADSGGDDASPEACLSTCGQAALWVMTRYVLNAPAFACVCVAAGASALQLVDRCVAMRAVDTRA